DIDQKINAKVEGASLKPYKILGLCNPAEAYQAISAVDNIGLFLPCKVILKYMEEHKTELVIINPMVMASFVENDKLKGVAESVTQKFLRAFNAVN
ncbi:MAG: DUF302 domain-containing protein, partial [Bacteroidales bacterium]|nr:DUF302 domain-containing protein [Bacteroidales bacterium]